MGGKERGRKKKTRLGPHNAPRPSKLQRKHIKIGRTASWWPDLVVVSGQRKYSNFFITSAGRVHQHISICEIINMQHWHITMCCTSCSQKKKKKVMYHVPLAATTPAWLLSNFEFFFSKRTVFFFFFFALLKVTTEFLHSQQPSPAQLPSQPKRPGKSTKPL